MSQYIDTLHQGEMELEKGTREICRKFTDTDIPFPYKIMAYTHENQEKILIRSLDEKNPIGYISRFMVGKQLDLYLSDEKGKRLKAYYFKYDTESFTRTTQEEIDREYAGSLIKEETDTILEGEMKFFVWVSRKRWGFIVLPILRENEVLYKGREAFFNFEDDTWEENFFSEGSHQN